MPTEPLQKKGKTLEQKQQGIPKKQGKEGQGNFSGSQKRWRQTVATINPPIVDTGPVRKFSFDPGSHTDLETKHEAWGRGNVGGILRDNLGEDACESKIATRQWGVNFLPRGIKMSRRALWVLRCQTTSKPFLFPALSARSKPTTEFAQPLALFKSPSGGGLTKVGSVTF